MTGCLYKLPEQKGLFKSIKIKKSTVFPYFFYGKILPIFNLNTLVWSSKYAIYLNKIRFYTKSSVYTIKNTITLNRLFNLTSCL